MGLQLITNNEWNEMKVYYTWAVLGYIYFGCYTFRAHIHLFRKYQVMD